MIKRCKDTTHGFSLLEMAMVMMVLAVLLTISGPYISDFVSISNDTYNQKQLIINQKISAGLMKYAVENTNQGTLPTPYTGSGYTSTILNPANTSLSAILTSSNILSTEINDDGYDAKNVRVYQKLSSITKQSPLFLQTGPLVNIVYDYGIVYNTRCPLNDATCNPNSTTGIPGASSVLNVSNYKTWTLTSPDMNVVAVSLEPLQQQLLKITADRLLTIRDKLKNYIKYQEQAAAPGDTTNFYLPSSPTLGGQTPTGAQQGCRDGWYNLYTTAGILDELGLSASEYGITGWGGIIEYCRDYDVNGTKTANAPPHYAALRIHNTPSTGSAANNPDHAVPGNNILLTF